MNITDNQEKIAIVEKLVNDKVIGFKEALLLLQEPFQSLSVPYQPLPPWPGYNPFDPIQFHTTCKTTVDAVAPELLTFTN